LFLWFLGRVCGFVSIGVVARHSAAYSLRNFAMVSRAWAFAYGGVLSLRQLIIMNGWCEDDGGWALYLLQLGLLWLRRSRNKMVSLENCILTEYDKWRIMWPACSTSYLILWNSICPLTPELHLLPSQVAPLLSSLVLFSLSNATYTIRSYLRLYFHPRFEEFWDPSLGENP